MTYPVEPNDLYLAAVRTLQVDATEVDGGEVL